MAADRTVIVLSGCRPGSEIHIWRAGITDGCDIFVYWYGRKCSISQHWSSYTCMYIFFIFFSIIGFPNGSLERICLQCKRYRRCEFDPWVRKIPLKEEMTTHSSILAWKILWTEEHAGLQSIGSQRVRHDWAHTHKILMLYRRTLLGFLTWGFFLVCLSIFI